MNIINEVFMEEIKCSDSLIGTKAIASCIGVLLYDDITKRAIVGHFNSNVSDSFEYEDALRIYKIIHKEIIKKNFKNVNYLIVPGIVGNKDRINNVAQELDNMLSKYNKMHLSSGSIMINEETESLEFVFEPKSGLFVTDLFYPGDIDYEVSKKKLR